MSRTNSSWAKPERNDHMESQAAPEFILAPVAKNDDWKSRRVTILIACLALVGMVCGCYALGSCDWFASEEGVVERGLGLFRYSQRSIVNEEEDESWQCQAYDNWKVFPITTNTDEKNKDVTKLNSWILAGRICALLAPMGVLVALFCLIWGGTYSSVHPTATTTTWTDDSSIMVDSNSQPDTSNSATTVNDTFARGRRRRCWAATFWLLATGLQAASCVSATALCGNGASFWECPWMQGAHANGLAALLYLICWLLTLCAYPRRGRQQEDEDVSFANHHHHHHHHYHETLQNKNETALPAVLEYGPHLQTAQELLGTADPVIHRAVGQQAQTIREFAKQESQV